MILIVSSDSAWAMTNSRPIADAPIVRNLCSSTEFGVRKGGREWITENGCSLTKTDYVLPLIRKIFPRIPFELHLLRVQTQ
jgi:hypothetical protein